MTPPIRAALQIGILVAVLVGLMLAFPAAIRVVEMAARELRFFWWVILLVALAVWLVWGLGRKPKG